MKFLKYLSIVFLLTSSSLESAVKLVEFFPPLSVVEGEDVKIQLRVSNPSQVSQIIVSYKNVKSRYKTVVLSKNKEYFIGYIPGKDVIPPEISLFIYYMDLSGQTHLLFASAVKPFKIKVTVQSKKKTELEEEFALFQAEDVVVSAARHKQKATKAPAAITVMDKNLIRQTGVFSLAELLKYVPGMEVYQLSPGYYIVGARGMADESNNMSLYLLDGMELNNQMFGIGFSEILPISLHDIERIEVIRGPGSALYGANAFSTVINIISIDPDKQQGYYFATYVGGYDTLYADVSLSAKKNEALSYSLSGMYRKSRAYDRNEIGFEAKLMRSVLKYKFYEQSYLKLSGGIIDAKADIFSNLGEVPTHGKINYVNAIYTLENFKARIFWSDTYADVEIANPLFKALLGNIYGTNDIFDGDFLYSKEFGKVDRLTGGVNVRYAFYQSEIFDPQYSDEKRLGVYLQNEWYPVDLVTLTLGARYDWNSTTKPGFSPKVCLIITPVDNNSIRLSYSRAFLKPSFYQNQMKLKKLENLNITWANKELDNEEMTAYELGYAAKYSKNLRFNIDLYYNMHRKAIQFSGSRLLFTNTGNDRDYFGGEISLRYGSKLISGFVNYSYMKIKNVAHNTYEDTHPEHSVNFGILGTFAEKLSYSLLGHYISKRYVELTNPIKGSVFVPYVENQELGNYLDLSLKLSFFITKEIEIGFYGKNLVFPDHREFAGDDNLKVSPDSEPQTFGGSKIPRILMGFVRATF